MPRFRDEKLNDAYDRTGGRCHICGKKLAWTNYGCFGERAAWEMEHSVPRALGGRDHGNNLFAACIYCNRRKGSRSSRSMRAEFGRRRAPMSPTRVAEVRTKRAVIGGTVGALLGAKFGPKVVVGVAILGALIGHSLDVDD
jgi:5-methylcytosine-specific restriction endonuclease McrA